MQLHDLLLHDSDRKLLMQLSESCPQSLLLDADRGFGKRTIALTLASTLSAGKQEYIKIVEQLDQSISIEQLRDLKKFFTLKTHTGKDKRVAIIVDADAMTTEAQNSLLKLLEEPPANCYLILTSAHAGMLLPTVISRLQTLHLRKVPPEQAEQYFITKGHKILDIQSAIAMTSGLAGATHSLLQGEADTFVASLNRAKELLGLKHVEKLRAVDALAKDKQSTLLVLDAFKTIATASLRKSSKHEDLWKSLLKSSSLAERQLAANASTKLVLTNLFLSL